MISYFKRELSMNIFITKKINIIKVAKIISLVYYLFLIYVLFFHFLRTTKYNTVNLTPFFTIIRYFKYYDIFTFKFWFLNIFGNIILFIPFGFLMPLTRNKPTHVIKILVITTLLCFIFELCQFIFKVGQFDIDDIILNTLGSFIGFLLVNFCKKKAYQGK